MGGEEKFGDGDPVFFMKSYKGPYMPNFKFIVQKKNIQILFLGRGPTPTVPPFPPDQICSLVIQGMLNFMPSYTLLSIKTKVATFCAENVISSLAICNIYIFADTLFLVVAQAI